MENLFGSGNSNKDINLDKALLALKRGSQLLKYADKGTPKFTPFRLSLVGFQRFVRHEKNHISFSVIYSNGKRSLDLICKDKIEAELWFAGLRALVASGQSGRSKIVGWNDEGISFSVMLNLWDHYGVLTPKLQMIALRILELTTTASNCKRNWSIFEIDILDLASNRTSDNFISSVLDSSSSEGYLIATNFSSITFEKSVSLERLDATNMHVKGTSSDVIRVSISSAPSTSSHGSAQDDPDNLGDVYVWGEVMCDKLTRSGSEKYDMTFTARSDILLPRPLEFNIVFDVQYMACGFRHAALVTRQGDVFTWGEESGGRLGHGVGTDIIQPHLVESLAVGSTEYVACGEFHTCALTTSGELYTWGDGTHNAGLLGHGSNVGHWVPKRVSGPIEGLQVSHVACGTWHTALITLSGQLFTFGDGTFGVLGHGSRDGASKPREVESLMGLKTISVACGVWHTAAIVEVIATQSISSAPSGKLFTWGDGDKFRLGHGDREPRLKPTCVPSLIDHNFLKIACGHSLTVGLTTSGCVFTMGSTVYGQLGNPFSDGKLPCLVDDKLSNEIVEEVTCGSYHVAVLTAKNEVYTWGKGANGRLGHGDIEDRKTPNLVEALKDRHVKHITCGSNFSAAICRHKMVSSAEQSQCSACRQAFGFTRKKHNCYNCGLVHCHSCTSRKALRAALAPNPAKPHRVCESCYQKLGKALGHSFISSRRTSIPHLSAESKDKFEQVKVEPKPSKAAFPSNIELIKQLDTKAAKYGKKTESLSSVRRTLVPSALNLKDLISPSDAELNQSIPKSGYKSSALSVSNSRVVSPFSRKSSPPRSATPIPLSTGLSLPKNIDESLKKKNDVLNQEVMKLRAQVESLRQHCQIQEIELQKSAKKSQEAFKFAAEESAKSKAAKEVIKSLTAQLKDMAERLPNGVYGTDAIKLAYLPNRSQPCATHHLNSNGETVFQNDSSSCSHIPSLSAENSTLSNGVSSRNIALGETARSSDSRSPFHIQRTTGAYSGENEDILHQRTNGGASSRMMDSGDGTEYDTHSHDSSDKSAKTASNYQVEAEWIEQYEPGVYLTLIALRDGTRDLKRVRFSRRRFGEQLAESWWSMNREKVYEKYNVRPSDKASSTSATQYARRSEEVLPSPQPR